MDIEKTFDSLTDNLLYSAIEKFGFGENFISWIKVLFLTKSCLSCSPASHSYDLLSSFVKNDIMGNGKPLTV